MLNDFVFNIHTYAIIHIFFTAIVYSFLLLFHEKIELVVR